MDWMTLVIAVLGSGAVSALVTQVASRHKTRADAHKTEAESANQITESALLLLDPLREQIANMQEQLNQHASQIEKLRKQNLHYAKRIELLTAGIGILISQLAEAKLEPAWKPDPWDPDPDMRS